jgi:hypothetical protein
MAQVQDTNTISCACPQCGRVFRIPAQLQGRKLICKGCQAHFIAQPGKGVPAAAAPAAPARAPAKPGGPAGATAAAPVVAAPAPVAATAAPAPSLSPTPDLPPIPIDDLLEPISLDGIGGPGQSSLVSTAQTLDKKANKVKLETTGPYFVVKLLVSGNMAHVNIEKTLNEYAAEGWLLQQVLPVGVECYAILKRGDSQPDAAKAAGNDDEAVDVKAL